MSPTKRAFVAPQLVEVASLSSLTQLGIVVITDCPRGQCAPPN
jgi:hypothetical protein